MTNRHKRIQKEIYNKFDFYNHPEYDDVICELEHDAYDFAYDNVDYDTIFEKYGIPTDALVYSDEYGVVVHRDDFYELEETVGSDILESVDDELTDAYFKLYHDKLYEYVENFIRKDE